MNNHIENVNHLIRRNLSDLILQDENISSPSHLSLSIGRDASYVRGILTGTFQPSTKALVDLGNKLNVPVYYFFMEHREETPSRKKLAAFLPCLSDEDCEGVLNLVQRLMSAR